MKKILFLLVLPLTLVGCANPIVNLTPGKMDRNSDGSYRLEAAWASHDYHVVDGSIKPTVMVNGNSVEMRPELVVNNRWETLVPIKSDEDVLHYRFRFDYIRTTPLGDKAQDSVMSPEYVLKVAPSK